MQPHLPHGERSKDADGQRVRRDGSPPSLGADHVGPRPNMELDAVAVQEGSELNPRGRPFGRRTRRGPAIDLARRSSRRRSKWTGRDSQTCGLEESQKSDSCAPLLLVQPANDPLGHQPEEWSPVRRSREPGPIVYGTESRSSPPRSLREVRGLASLPRLLVVGSPLEGGIERCALRVDPVSGRAHSVGGASGSCMPSSRPARST